MKKVLFAVMAALSLASCSSDEIVTPKPDNDNPTVETRTTQVYAQGRELSFVSTQSAASVATTATTHYYIRIDGRIPEIKNDYCPSEQYLPQKSKGSGDMTLVSDKNAGVLNIDYPFSTEGVVWPITRYVYDSTGEEVKKVIISEPDLYTLLHANENTDFDAIVNKLNLDSCKVIWYVAREGQKNGWHVDGVLTMKSTKDVTEIPGITIDEEKNYDNKADKPTLPDTVVEGNGNVEVNVHQQLHQDWEEIKTSIHVRDLINGVTVEIPLEKENVAEADDFAIRTYDYDLESKVFLNGKEYVLNDNNPIKITIEHQADKVVIAVSAINPDYITALRKAYGDGLTIEVHTYPKNLTKGEIWSRVQQTKVKVNPTTYDSSKLKVSLTKYDDAAE